MSYLKKCMDIHEEFLRNNSYCYFELAYTRQTEWMLWVCSKPKEQDPNREVLLCGQGETPEDAARDALNKYKTG